MFRLSLSWKLLLGVLPLLLLVLAISVVVQNRFQEIEMMDQAQTTARTYADIVRESMVSMMVHSAEIDTSFLLRINNLHQFDTLHVLTNDLHLRFELLDEDQVERIRRRPRVLGGTDELQNRVLRSGDPVFVRAGDEFRAVIPFNATSVCQKCHNVPIRETLGAADLRFSMVRFSEATAGNWQRSILIFLVFSVVAISLATIIFKRNVSGPIDRLVTATKEIQKGNLDYRIPLQKSRDGSTPRDELDFLAERFEEMRSTLAEKIAELDRANRALSRRNGDVEMALEELRRAQQELVRNERLAATGKMAAQLSHEINNPIHNTQSLLESSLRRLREDDPPRELVALALEEIGRVARLTRQLLDVYRGSVVEEAYTDVDLVALLRDLERLHGQGLAQNGVKLILRVPPDLPRVSGAPDKLKQVFLNLLLNARDAMPSGGTVTISAAGGEQELMVTVADTGVGIPAENRERVFEAFFTTKREVSGVGLGLAVTNGIVRQHQGTVSFESKVGAGTTFTIRLPVQAGGNHGGRHG